MTRWCIGRISIARIYSCQHLQVALSNSQLPATLHTRASVSDFAANSGIVQWLWSQMCHYKRQV